MDCGVCLGGYDGGSDTDFYFTRKPKARVEHRCAECERVITPGTVYVLVGGRCEGAFWRQKTCVECFEINTVFSCGNSVMFGNFWCDMEEIVFPELTVRNPCLHKLSNEARAFLTERWFKWKEMQIS